MATYQSSKLILNRPRFSEIAKLIGKEGDQLGKGPIVLPAAIIAYREAWQIYRAFARTILLTQSAADQARWDTVAEFIDDDVRTILIARSIRRAVETLLSDGRDELQVIEAGFGTGFLAAVALATDSKVKLVGYDLQQAKVSVAQEVCSQLGFAASRFHFDQKVISPSDSNHKKADVLVVAEHISAGLMHELTTDIPRSIPVDPQFCIPHSVHPQLFVGTPGGATVLSGPEIVLGSTLSGDEVLIEGNMTIPANHRSLITVANGVTWSGITLSGLPDVQQRDTRHHRIDGKRNHLLRPTGLHASMDRTNNSFWWIANDSDFAAEVSIRVQYPVGFLANQKGEPHVTLLGESKARVFKGPIDAYRFAQYVAGMMRGEADSQ